MTTLAAARKILRKHALALPGAWEDHPWGEDVAKVGKKVFVFFGIDGPELFVGVKLPRSLPFAKTQPFVKKFGYGLDSAGWVAARFAKGESVPVDLLRGWIDESFEAVAPKRSRPPPVPARQSPRRRRSASSIARSASSPVRSLQDSQPSQ